MESLQVLRRKLRVCAFLVKACMFTYARLAAQRRLLGFSGFPPAIYVVTPILCEDHLECNVTRKTAMRP